MIDEIEPVTYVAQQTLLGGPAHGVVLSVSLHFKTVFVPVDGGREEYVQRELRWDGNPMQHFFCWHLLTDDELIELAVEHLCGS